MKYKILTSRDAEELSLEVEKYLQDGWEPIGGVSVCNAENANEWYEIYAQAIILRPKSVVFFSGTLPPFQERIIA